jgi:hypothetical protein
LLGLDAQRTAWALGHAATQSASLVESIGSVKEPFTQFVECGPPMKDQVVAQFDRQRQKAVRI